MTPKNSLIEERKWFEMVLEPQMEMRMKTTKPVKKTKNVKSPRPTRGEKSVIAAVEAKPSTRKATPDDLVEVSDSNFLVSIDLRRQPNDFLSEVEIQEGQRLFPYSVLPRLLIGWQTVGFISSFEMKLSSESVLPQITVRFIEKMSAEDVKNMDAALRAQVEQQIALVKQFPFVTVVSPLSASS